MTSPKSSKTAPWQKPWLMELLDAGLPFQQELVTGAMWRMVQRTVYRRALIMVGVDDGYWREERVFERDVGWWAITDSHRSPAAERNVSVIASGAHQLFEQIWQVCHAPPPLSIVRYPGWVEENQTSHATAVPVVAYRYGAKAVVARGFGFDRWLWSLLEEAAKPPEVVRYQTDE